MADRTGCTRRTALLALGGFGLAAGLAGPLGARLPGAPGSERPTGAVVAYFNDGLMADPSATLPPYRRPGGYRGTGRTSRMSEAERIAAGFAL
ncbi:hypothetical protein [Croceibacterium aestuarii]|uniref:hypothetical protein n=1 Tax=Croceibacterium aestuarii TaxID=3064139 RepID=UPI00272DD243|nr:hypothetical protein [Croceibacterium sp. D39]